MSVYTLGVWTAKLGQEAAFVAAWREFAENTATDFPGSAAMLLRDRDRPNLFVSYGPWASIEDIASWRGSATFEVGVAKIRACLEDFQPHTMDPVAAIGGPSFG
ncbi:MAG: hypothetical protein NVSMB55_01350 [Mycobacteriales bacterium]